MSCVHSTPAQGRSRGRAPLFFYPRVPATPRVPLRCVRYYDAKIRLRSTKALCKAGSSADGKLVKVRAWLDALTTKGKGPLYGYHLNPSKSVLLVKPAVLGLAQELFRDTGVTIRVDGCCYLGTAEFLQSYVEGKVQSWIGQLERLAVIASSQPQAAFSAITSGLKHKWSFLCRTMSNAAQSFGPLESAIRDKLIPAITGRTSDLRGGPRCACPALPLRGGLVSLTRPSWPLSISHRSKSPEPYNTTSSSK